MMENQSKKIPIRLTIKTPFVDRYNITINYGGAPFWCMFDFAVLPKPESKELDVKLAEGIDNETVKWFPHLQKGILRGYQTILETERIIVNVCIEIKKFCSPNRYNSSRLRLLWIFLYSIFSERCFNNYRRVIM